MGVSQVGQSAETHEAQRHQAGGDEADRRTAEMLGYIGLRRSASSPPA